MSELRQITRTALGRPARIGRALDLNRPAQPMRLRRTGSTARIASMKDASSAVAGAPKSEAGAPLSPLGPLRRKTVGVAPVPAQPPSLGPSDVRTPARAPLSGTSVTAPVHAAT